MDSSNVLGFWFTIYGASSIGLTLLNKSLAISFPSPFLVLTIQNIASVGMTFLADRMGVLLMSRWKVSHILATLPVASLYVFVLYTSLVGLSMVSVPLLVACRNLMPLATALGEMIFLGERFPMDQLASLLVVFMGAALYTANDSSFSFTGIGFVFVNMMLTTALALVEKRISNKYGDQQTPTGIRCYRDLLSVPFFAVLAFAHSNLAVAKSEMKANAVTVLLVSCLLSFGIGLAGYSLQKLVAATSIVVANIVCKLITTFASFLFFPVDVHPLGWLGMLIGFAGVVWYSWLRQRQKRHPALPITQSNATSRYIAQNI